MPTVGDRRVCCRRAAAIVALVALAAALRVYGIGKESLWSDEVWSVEFSDNTVAEVLEDNARDVHPPLYYLGLHYWRLALGDSDVRFRLYSLLWSVLGVAVIFLFATSAGGRGVGLTALVLAAVNPLDVYYAQEARNYSQVAALCTLGSFCLWRWMLIAAGSVCHPGVGPKVHAEGNGPHARRWWPWAMGYGLCAAAALHTHYMSVFVLLAQGVFALIWFAHQGLKDALAGYVAGALVVAAGFLPWLGFVHRFRPELYHDGLRWIEYPPPSDYYSFLGREFFWGRVQSVHDLWWRPTMILPVCLIAFCVWLIYRDATGRSRGAATGRRQAVAYLLWLVAGPVLLAALTGQVYHPIYYRAKFSTFVLAPFLLLAAIACASIRRRIGSRLSASVLGGFMLAAVFVQTETYERLDWRSFAKAWRGRGPPALAAFFPRGGEAALSYYLKEPVTSRSDVEIKRRLPELEGRELWVCSWSDYKFNLIQGERDYYRWLLGLGSAHEIYVPNFLRIWIVTIGRPYSCRGERLDEWYPPLDVPSKLAGFNRASGFWFPECAEGTTVPFRWSAPKAWFCLHRADVASTVILNVELPAVHPPRYRPDLRVYAKRGDCASGLFATVPIARIPEDRTGDFEVQLPRFGEEGGPLWIGWTVTAVNPARVAGGRDSRDLGLRFNWVGMRYARRVMIGLQAGERAS